MMDNYKDIGSIQPKIKNINNNDSLITQGVRRILDIFASLYKGRIFKSIEIDTNQYDNQLKFLGIRLHL